MHSALLEEAARREGLPGRGSEVGKFWGSGEGVGGGLNFSHARHARHWTFCFVGHQLPNRRNRRCPFVATRRWRAQVARACHRNRGFAAQYEKRPQHERHQRLQACTRPKAKGGLGWAGTRERKCATVMISVFRVFCVYMCVHTCAFTTVYSFHRHFHKNAHALASPHAMHRQGYRHERWRWGRESRASADE